MESATVGDLQVTSSHESADEIRAALTDAPAPPVPPSEPTQQPLPETPDGVPVVAPPEPEPAGERDPKTGQFKPKTPKPRHDAQARIDQLTKEREDARREAAAVRAELEAARRASQPPPPAPQPQPARSEPSGADPEPNPDDLTKYPDGQFDRKYARDLATWVARQEYRAADTRRQQEQAERARFETVQKQASEFYSKLSSALKADPAFHGEADPGDAFMATLHPALRDAKPLSALDPEEKARIAQLPAPERNQLSFHAFLAEQAFRSDHPKDVLGYMSENLQRLATLRPDQLIRDLAIFESRLGAASPAAPAPAAVSHAKPPIQPLGSSPHAADPYEVTDDMPFEEWKRRMDAKDRRAGRL